MLKTIQRLFAPPVFEDEDKTRTAFYLNSVSLSAVGVLGLYLIVQNLAGPGFNLNVVDYLLLGFIGLLLVARYAMLKGYVKIASHVVVGFIWLGLAFQAQMADGIRDATFFAFFVIILMASLLLGTRGMLFYSALSILMGFGLVYLENVRGGAIALDSSQNFVRDITFVFVLFAIFLYLVTSNLSNALNRARLTAQELQKNNEQLLALQTELEARVAARTRDLEIVTEVGAVAATILESKRLLQEMVKLTQERFNLYHAQIYLLDDAGESLVLAAGVVKQGAQWWRRGKLFLLIIPILWWPASRVNVRASSLTMWPRRRVSRPTLCCPIHARNWRRRCWWVTPSSVCWRCNLRRWGVLLKRM